MPKLKMWIIYIKYNKMILTHAKKIKKEKAKRKLTKNQILV